MTAPGAEFRLPDFCARSTVFTVMTSGLLLAMLIALLSGADSPQPLLEFVLVVLFVEWVAVLSLAALCVLRPLLESLTGMFTAVAAAMVPVALTMIVGEASMWVLWFAGARAEVHDMDYPAFQARNFLVSFVVSGLIVRYLVARHELTRQIADASQARAQVENNRVRTHFLVNSLNSITGLVGRAPVSAQNAAADLAELLRQMLKDDGATVPLDKELSAARKFIALERYRLEDRLTVDWPRGRMSRTVRTPSQSLQLLLETLIYHGVETRTEGGQLEVTVDNDGQYLTIDVTGPAGDDLPGGAGDLENTPTISLLRQRLDDHYPGDYLLNCSIENGLMVLSMRHPLSPAA